MKIVIAGGTGFLGENLEKYFTEKGDQVFILTRNPKRKNEIYWNAESLGEWQRILDGSDVLINLTGKSVDCRYNEKNKREIYTSRISSTRILQEAVTRCKVKPVVWLNASSATIYIHSETQQNTEKNGIIGDDFSMNICKSWEKEFFSVQSENVRKVALRTSIVLGCDGGAFPKLRMITKLGLGGKQGRGDQKVSWIHIDDFCRAVEWIIRREDISDVINITSPEPVSNNDLMKTMRKLLKIPFGLNAPVWQLEIASALLGTETELLLKSRNVYPEKIMRSGFQFTYFNLKEALKDLLKS
ncbi:TIGR01777 family oxidoreductase [Chryseobacterium indologenes]|uniref:NAD-dependent epimerase n=1 Tax=Chryseobacterium indologenes TaxID=253 RepID=A0A0N1KUM6_CHRID|nr:TIGR01777 family oxidoreductase [Chryseobacterium indologenes]KPE52865.1 NAD-dependent epimerase [Chryseobacterium indologenes]